MVSHSGAATQGGCLRVTFLSGPALPFASTASERMDAPAGLNAGLLVGGDHKIA
jgi:hypothetical protein